MYKRLAEVRSDEDVDLLREELLDRYGEPPQEVAERCCRWRASGPGPGRPGSPRSPSQGKYVRFAPVDLPDSRVVRLKRLYPKSIVKAAVAYDAGAAPADRRSSVGRRSRRGAA